MLRCEALWNGDAWQTQALLGWDAEGRLRPSATATESRQWVLPGIANLHSHAFQRAMAGLTERQGSNDDSFWTWREWMYRFAGQLTPDDVQAIAAQLYVEMLEAGYTSVCEFHYLHHAADGRPHANPAAMSEAIIAAAREAGIRLTLLPVLYQRGGFDGRALNDRQRRFGHQTDDFIALVHALRKHEDARTRVGVAFHSLRAVPLAAMQAVLNSFDEQLLPVHIHIAEQMAEVDDCVALHGRRPVQLLLDEMPVGPDWTLVHATHLDAREVEGIARSGATVAICTSTEGNLGDGLFPLRPFLQAGGRYGVGSDSHISVSPVEELRWLEYGQRLQGQRRNLATLHEGSTGEAMLRAVADSASRATGQAIGCLMDGQRADMISLDARASVMIGAKPASVADRFIFAGNAPLVESAWVNGERVVEAGRHKRRDAIRQRYVAVMERLLAE